MNTCYSKRATQYMTGGIAKAGVHFHTYSENTKSDCQTYHTNVEEELHHLMSGGFFVDMRHCTIDQVIEHALRGPMLDLAKPSDYCEHDPPGALSYVGLTRYLQNAIQHGAKVGMRLNDNIYWHNGNVTTVQPCNCWIHVCMGCNKWRHLVDIASGSVDNFTSRARVPSDPHDHCPECKAQRE